MCRFCWILVLVLGMSTAFMTYKFILSGSAIKSEDGRLAILLTSDERNLVLSEMRTFLDSVQRVTQSVASNDFKAVAEAAQKVGRAAQQSMPGSLIGKLPLDFKKMGSDTHAKFSELALDAEQLGDGEHTLMQLSNLLQNCVTCHATFKLEIAVD